MIPVTDTLARPLKDLRISVMDRCNLRCTYCMPEESLHGKGVFLPSHHLLSDGEIELLVRVFTSLGVHKVRLTGGEPLLRPGLADLIGDLTRLENIDDIALTTNGILLAQHAAALKAAVSILKPMATSRTRFFILSATPGFWSYRRSRTWWFAGAVTRSAEMNTTILRRSATNSVSAVSTSVPDVARAP